MHSAPTRTPVELYIGGPTSDLTSRLKRELKDVQAVDGARYDAIVAAVHAVEADLTAVALTKPVARQHYRDRRVAANVLNDEPMLEGSSVEGQSYHGVPGMAAVASSNSHRARV